MLDASKPFPLEDLRTQSTFCRIPTSSSTARHQSPTMSMFRPKKLDLSCFTNVRVLRDHAKRQVFQEHETQR
ncbi:hypothetical protein HYQ44_001125 [Verticillium longisporum]|nr:hypothetical protein HYQ44_001125 [Verticillium longisporum]